MAITYGWLSEVLPVGGWFVFVGALIGLGFFGAPIWAWTIGLVLLLASLGVSVPVVGVVGGIFGLMSIPPIRRVLVSGPIMGLMDRLKIMPVISETEKTALDAGTTWVEAELFSGRPDFNKVRKEPYRGVSAEEQAFLDNQVKHLTTLASDWDVYQHKDLPKKCMGLSQKRTFFRDDHPKRVRRPGLFGDWSQRGDRKACHPLLNPCDDDHGAQLSGPS